eukprot:4465360-Alexandrium_andersonii.AAC.1
MTGAAQLEQAVRRRGFDFGTGVWRDGDPCQLCGLGEFGAEHLLVWCPTVGDALRALDLPAAT